MERQQRHKETERCRDAGRQAGKSESCGSGLLRSGKRRERIEARASHHTGEHSEANTDAVQQVTFVSGW